MNQPKAAEEEAYAGDVEPPRMKNGGLRSEVGLGVKALDLEREETEWITGRIIDRVAEHAEAERAGADIDPTEYEAEPEGDRRLRGIEVHQRKEGGGGDDGGPWLPATEKTPEDKAAENDFLGDGGDDDGEGGSEPWGGHKTVQFGREIPAIKEVGGQVGAEEIVDFRQKNRRAGDDGEKRDGKDDRRKPEVPQPAPGFMGAA